MVGVFRRNESVAIRGKVKAGGVQKLLDDLSHIPPDNQPRRSSEGSLVVNNNQSIRRNSSPGVSHVRLLLNFIGNIHNKSEI